MKKTILATMLSACFGIAAFGQGQITFGNSASTLITTNSPNSTGPMAGLGNYAFALVISNSPTTFAFSGLQATNLAAVGRLNGGSSVPITQPVATAAGQIIFGEVIGWSIAGIGSTYANFLTWFNSGNPLTPAYYGVSALGMWTLGGGAQPVQTIFGALNVPGSQVQIPGFVMNLTPVPEPTTFALAGLGAASLLIFRRRKQ